MRNTNTKSYKADIRAYILENLGCTLEEALQRYNEEYNGEWEKKAYPSEVTRLENYIMGIPFNFPYDEDDIRADIAKLHNVKESDIKQVWIDNYFNHIATHMLRGIK